MNVSLNRQRMKGYAWLFASRLLRRPFKTYKLLRTFARHMKTTDLGPIEAIAPQLNSNLALNSSNCFRAAAFSRNFRKLSAAFLADHSRNFLFVCATSSLRWLRWSRPSSCGIQSMTICEPSTQAFRHRGWRGNLRSCSNSLTHSGGGTVESFRYRWPPRQEGRRLWDHQPRTISTAYTTRRWIKPPNA